MMHNKMLHMVASILLIVGGLNMGISAVGPNVLGMLPESIGMVVSILIGLSAVLEIMSHKSNCKVCSVGGSSDMTHG